MNSEINTAFKSPKIPSDPKLWANPLVSGAQFLHLVHEVMSELASCPGYCRQMLLGSFLCFSQLNGCVETTPLHFECDMGPMDIENPGRDDRTRKEKDHSGLSAWDQILSSMSSLTLLDLGSPFRSALPGHQSCDLPRSISACCPLHVASPLPPGPHTPPSSGPLSLPRPSNLTCRRQRSQAPPPQSRPPAAPGSPPASATPAPRPGPGGRGGEGPQVRRSPWLSLPPR